MSGVRIKDDAKLSGVSAATASHVINKTRYVSDETKRRVLGAIENVGYTPNIRARNLASGRSRTLGLIISDITNPFFPDLIKFIQDRALELGYDLIVLSRRRIVGSVCGDVVLGLFTAPKEKSVCSNPLSHGNVWLCRAIGS